MNVLALGSAVPGAMGSGLDVLFASGLLLALPLGVAGLALLRFGLLPRLSESSPRWRDRARTSFLAGLAAAFALLLVALAPPALLGAFRPGADGYAAFVPARGPAAASGTLPMFGFFALQSLTEELLFRAFFLTVLAGLLLFAVRLFRGPLPPKGDPLRASRAAQRWFGAGILANAGQAFAFALLHARNPNVTPLALVNVGLAGAVLGWLFWSEAGLAGCWTFHAVWNFTLAALALPVSGLTFGPPLVSSGVLGAGLPALSGGAFGPEGSIPGTLGLAAVLAVLIRRSARRLASEYPSTG